MRCLRFACWPAPSAAASAQRSPRDKIEVQAVRVGFPPGPTDGGRGQRSATRSSLYKAGAWTPVYIDLDQRRPVRPGPEKGRPGRRHRRNRPTATTRPTPTLSPFPAFDEQEGLAGQASVVAYTRTGSRYGDFTIRVVAGGKDLCQPFKLGQQAGGFTTANGLDPNQGLYLALGTRLPGLRGLGKRDQDPNQPAMSSTWPRSQVRRRPAGPRSTTCRPCGSDTTRPTWSSWPPATATSPTGLLNDRVRTAALAEWVRRGGRLIVCAGGNADVLTGPTELNAMLPVDIGKPYTAPALHSPGGKAAAQESARGSRTRKSPLSLTGLVPQDKPARGLPGAGGRAAGRGRLHARHRSRGRMAWAA